MTAIKSQIKENFPFKNKRKKIEKTDFEFVGQSWKCHKDSLWWRDYETEIKEQEKDEKENHEEKVKQDEEKAESKEIKICAFDLDFTLIKTKSKKKFRLNEFDWEFFDENVPMKIKQMHSEKWVLAIFSNQMGVSKGKTPLKRVTKTIDAIQKRLKVPFLAFVGTKDDLFRKPCIAGWEFMLQILSEKECKARKTVNNKNGNFRELIVTKKIYVGDAAGRPKTNFKAKDFSASDLKFALNLKAEFYTPEMFFLNMKKDFEENFDFDPSKLNYSDIEDLRFQKKKDIDMPEIVILVGSPGSGKSTLCQKYFPSYCRINQDTMGTKAKCFEKFQLAIKQGKNVIVDNQNKEKSTRNVYIDEAKKYGFKCRAIYLNISKDLCFHMNKYRTLTCLEDTTEFKPPPQLVIHSFYKYVEAPEESEGFDEVITITDKSFIFGFFKSEKHKKLFLSYL